MIMRRVIKVLVLVAFLMLTGYNVYRTQPKVKGLVDFCLSEIEVLANGEEITGDCTVTYTCLDTFNNPDGSIGCSGSNYCKRGITKDYFLGIVISESRWVECDGKRTYCNPEIENG